MFWNVCKRFIAIIQWSKPFLHCQLGNSIESWIPKSQRICLDPMDFRAIFHFCSSWPRQKKGKWQKLRNATYRSLCANEKKVLNFLPYITWPLDTEWGSNMSKQVQAWNWTDLHCLVPSHLSSVVRSLFSRAICSNGLRFFEEEMRFQASMHQTEKNLKSAIGQKGPHPPFSSLKQAGQKQLTTKKRGKGEEWKKGCIFFS